ncbi:MAG: hypothetical protein ABIC68_08385 [Candidatus Omnitrophota bacterium]
MSENIIQDKFTEWTADKNALEARIAVFNYIRDIPYGILPELRDPVTGPVRMLEINVGSCVPKHFLLANFFEKLKIPVKYVTYLFSWNDFKVKYLPDLLKIVKAMPIGTHLACKAYINGKWVLVDATFESALQKRGFPVTENWDGVSNTKNAVKPIKEIIHETLEDRLKYIAECKKSWSPAQVHAYEEFPPLLNSWLSFLRRQ